MNFKELNLISPILKAIEREGYESPSPIQAESIPQLLAGRDLLGCAQTGTGKTAAFAIPILQMLYERRQTNTPHALQALVLTPTRELAAQVGQSFQAYGRYTGLKTAVIFGGVGQAPQVAALRGGIDILVATPGRLNDLIGQGLCDLGGISMFVLDEADRMLDMGFIHDVKKVIAKLPTQRQTLLFSATMPTEISALAASILHNPITVAVTPVSSTVEAISQSIYFVDKSNKIKLLVDLLQDETITSALVFSRTKHGADRIGKALNRTNIAAGVIHGDKSQGARETALANFKTGKTRILVATDIAARGIDIDELSHVVNYDLPNEPETYVHRIGRTGRAGLSGVAISFCDFGEKAYLKDIQKLIGMEIPVAENHAYPMEVFEVIKPQQRQARVKTETIPKPEKAPREEKPKMADKSAKMMKTSAKCAVSIIFEDNDLIAIDKPAGMLSISSDTERENTAYHKVYEYMKAQSGRVFVVHRLDRETSGIMLLAKNEQAKLALQDNWDKLVSKRGYIAVVEGKPSPADGRIVSWLKQTKTLLVYSSSKEGDGKRAITNYRTIRINDKYSLLELSLETGRKNQIRVHMQDKGCPIAGDKKYGAKTSPFKRLGLHANLLIFKHPTTGETIRIEAKTPAVFTEALKLR